MFRSEPSACGCHAVTCNKPVAWVITGAEEALPNFTIWCSGGSSVGNIVYFSYEVAKNPTVSQLLATVTVTHAIQTGDGPMTIYSNLNDLSGSAWGCGTANLDLYQTLNRRCAAAALPSVIGGI